MPMGRRDGVRRPSAEVKQCGRCAFWDCMNPRKSSATGLCRIYPPKSHDTTVIPNSRHAHHVYKAIWPETLFTDWCGQFEQR